MGFNRASQAYNPGMDGKDRRSSQELAREFMARGDSQGWFEELYRQAEGDPSFVPWADLQPSPLLLQLLDAHLPKPDGPAVVVGCGLGDDAEELARRGLNVTAFDLSETAIRWCHERWPDSPVEYREADLLHLPAEMNGRFGLVVEINTLQAVPDALRLRMFAPLAGMLAPGGRLVVICRVREEGERIEGPPWALCRSELDMLTADHGLENERFELLSDGEDPPRVRYVTVFRRPPA